MTNYELIEQHYKEHYNIYLKVARFRSGLSPEACEDVVQEAYTRSLKYSDIVVSSGIDAYMRSILNASIIDYVRKERGYTEDIDDDEIKNELSTNDPFLAAITLKEIDDLIKDHEHSEVLTLFFKHGVRPKDIPEITEYTHANVRTIISRFRDYLKGKYTD